MCDAFAVGDQVLTLLDLIREQGSRVTSPEDRMYLEAARDVLGNLGDPATTLAGESVSSFEQHTEKTRGMNMSESAFQGQNTTASNVENNSALPHVVPPRTPGEKANSSELPDVKNGSEYCTSKICFQPGVPALPAVRQRVLRGPRAKPAPGQVSGIDHMHAQGAHCSSCQRAGFVSGRCPA